MITGAMQLNDAGKLIAATWAALPRHHVNVTLDAFVVMPNHLHGIVVLSDGANKTGVMNHAPTVAKTFAHHSSVGAQFIAPDIAPVRTGMMNHTPTKSAHPTLGAIIRGYKARCTLALRRAENLDDLVLWQRNYYEHVVRDEASLREIRQYIVNNPLQWLLDRENPERITR